MPNKTYVTCSALARITKCPPSAIYPSIRSDGDSAKVGSAGHAVLEYRCHQRQMGKTEEEAYEASLENIDTQAKKFELNQIETAMLAKAVKRFKWCPPDGTHAEMAFSMARDMSVRPVPKDKAAPGHYGVDLTQWCAGTADLIYWVKPGEVLMVADYKFGDEVNVTPIEFNPQLWALAYMAGTHFNAKKVIPAIIFIRDNHENGIWESPDDAPLEMSHGKMWQFSLSMQQLARVLDNLRLAYDKGESLDHKCAHGSHCQYCPAAWGCEYYLGYARGLLGISKLQQPSKSREPLTPEEAVDIARAIGGMERACRNARILLESYVGEHGPIDLGDSNSFGFVEGEKEFIIPNRRTYEILWEQFGEGTWELMKITKSGLYDGCRELALQKGEKIAHMNRKVMSELQVGCCLDRKPTRTLKTFRPDIEVVAGKDEEMEES
jgi:Protein of unknown function (DUF2800)